MASVVPLPMINAKVYRHFAAVTAAITLCVAVFADGEAHQVAADEVASHNEHVRLEKMSVEKTGEVRLGDNRFKSGHGQFGEDFDEGYGDSSEVAASRVDTEYARPPRLAAGAAAAPQLTQAQYEAMSPEQQAAYLDQVKRRKAAVAQAAQPQAPTQSEIAALTAASAARSGSSSID